MGLNGALHDAFNLAERLLKVWQGGDTDLLDQYERQRRPLPKSLWFRFDGV